MEISSLDSAPALVAIARTSQAWAIGQLLDITVIGSESAKSSLVQIEPGRTLATVDAKLPLGLRFQARVAAVTPQPVLMVTDTRPPPPASATETVPLPAAVALSRQRDFASTLTILKQILASPTATALSDSRAVPTLGTVVTRIIENAPDLQQLVTPTALRSAVEHEGSALEATLARAISSVAARPAPPPTDWKWLMLESLSRLHTLPMPQPSGGQTALTPATALTVRESRTSSAVASAEMPISALKAQDAIWSEANSALDGFAARITLRQLQSVEAQHQGILYGMFEIPVTVAGDVDVLTLVYSRDHAQDPWHDHPLEKLLVVIPLGERRELRVELAARGSALQVSTWSDDNALNQLAINHAEQLRARLSACGFDVTSITAKAVTPPSLLSHLPKTRFVQQA